MMRKQAFGVVAILAMVLSGACGADSNCFKGISRGERYRVKLIEPYLPALSYYTTDLDNTVEEDCGALDGLVAGVGFSFWIAERRETVQCEVYRATLRPDTQDIPGVTIKPMRATATDAQNFAAVVVEMYSGGYLVDTSSGCSGSWGFNLKSAGGAGLLNDFFSPSLPGQAPPMLLERWFIPDGSSAGACKRCSDTFTAHLERP